MPEDMTPGEAAYTTLRSYLAHSEWDAAEDASNHLFTAYRDGQFCPLGYYFRLFPERCQFAFYIVPDIEIPGFKMTEAAEYLCRVNSGMRIGNFELDFGNRRVRFKSSLGFEGSTLTVALLEAAINPAIEAFDEYFIGLGRVLSGVASPVQAINEIDYEP
jgi:hypothetical protein